MRALVTGGAGFIGSHLVDLLLADGHDVDVVDNLSTGSMDNLASAIHTGRCQATVGDITLPGFVDWVGSQKPEVIFHLAAQIDVRASVANPLLDAVTNVLGTVNVLDAARRARARKVVNVSSVAIYGPPEQLPVTEGTQANPISPYATSKLSAEMYCQQYRRLHGVDFTTVVLANVYGPRQRAFGVVPVFMSAMLAGRPAYLYGGGSNIRDYVYVGDVVDALIRASAPGIESPRVNVGTGIPVTDRQLYDAVAGAVGAVSRPVELPVRLGDIPAMLVDATVARTVLGWTPRTSLAAGIAAVAREFRDPSTVAADGCGVPSVPACASTSTQRTTQPVADSG